MKQVFCLAFMLAFSTASLAQLSEKIETDRPDQTESPFVVPQNYFQGEMGFNLMNYKSEVRQIIHPTALLKYGLNNRMELRLEGAPYTESFPSVPNSEKEFNLEPVEIGTKIRLFEEKGLRPKTSVIAHVGLPFLATGKYRHRMVPYIVRMTMQHTITEVVGLGYNIGVERDAEETTSLFYTFAPSFNIGEKWYTYIEAFGSFADGENEHNFDGGIAFNPTSNTRLDLSAGFGLGNAPLKNYVALGFSFRLPLHRR